VPQYSVDIVIRVSAHHFDRLAAEEHGVWEDETNEGSSSSSSYEGESLRCVVLPEYDLFCMEIISTPSAQHRNNGPFRLTTALQMPKVGVSASPWMWAKARCKLGALIRLCGDGVVSNKCSENGWMGSFCMEIISTPSTQHRNNGPFRPTTAQHCRCPKLAFPPRPGCGRRLEAN
jgi:hypothetical protein